MRRETSLYITLLLALTACPLRHAAAQNVPVFRLLAILCVTESKGLKAGSSPRLPCAQRTLAGRRTEDAAPFSRILTRISSRDKDTVRRAVRGQRSTCSPRGPCPDHGFVIKVKLPRPYDEGEIRSIAEKSRLRAGNKRVSFERCPWRSAPRAPGRGTRGALGATKRQYAFPEPRSRGK